MSWLSHSVTIFADTSNVDLEAGSVVGAGESLVRVRCDISELTPLVTVGFLFDMQWINFH
jgi:hypothetical protein